MMRGSQKASAQTGGLLAMASKTSVETGGAKLITGLPDELLPSLSTSGETLTGTQGMTYEIGGGSPDLVAGLPARHLRAGPSTDRTPCHLAPSQTACERGLRRHQWWKIRHFCPPLVIAVTTPPHYP